MSKQQLAGYSKNPHVLEIIKRAQTLKKREKIKAQLGLKVPYIPLTEFRLMERRKAGQRFRHI